ncbi:1151_t:CDS:2, partial [Funneliformis caledonium]
RPSVSSQFTILSSECDVEKKHESFVNIVEISDGAEHVFMSPDNNQIVKQYRIS